MSREGYIVAGRAATAIGVPLGTVVVKCKRDLAAYNERNTEGLPYFSEAMANGGAPSDRPYFYDLSDGALSVRELKSYIAFLTPVALGLFITAICCFALAPATGSPRRSRRH